MIYGKYKKIMKHSVLIIADFPNWAYHEIQKFVKTNLSNEFDIYCDFLVFNSIKKSKNPINRIKLFNNKCRYQDIRSDNTYDIVVYLGFYFTEEMKITWRAKKIIKGIYTDGFPPKNANFSGSLSEFTSRFLNDADAIVCGSLLIKEYYKKEVEKIYYANFSHNQNQFKRLSNKSVNTSEDFVVGWTGNPERAFKGFYTHIVPAIKLAQFKYPKIQFKTRFSGPIETLPGFYDDVDVVVIASDADAGPSLFGEACLMDVPSISTDIGKPHEVIVDTVNGFIVDKNIEQISNRIIELYEDRELLFEMSKKVRADFLKVFNNIELAEKWRFMFNDLLNTSDL